MVALGCVVGKSSTPIDDWFHRYSDSPARHLIIIADPHVLVGLMVVVFVGALFQRRWRLAAMAVLAPAVGIVVVRLLKPLFDRERGGDLSYPSGHITTTTIVFGLIVLLLGTLCWVVALAVVFVGLAMVGVGVTFHYFTDVAGGLLLGTAIICIAAHIASPDLTPVNPAATCVTLRG
jgi:membrane-associated phospholipid phosphatase